MRGGRRDRIPLRLVGCLRLRAVAHERHGVDRIAGCQRAGRNEEFVAHEVQRLAVGFLHVPRRNPKHTLRDRQRTVLGGDLVVFKARTLRIGQGDRISLRPIRGRRRRAVALQRHRLHLVVVLKADHRIRRQRHRVTIDLRHVVGPDRQHTLRDGELAGLRGDFVVFKARPLYIGQRDLIALCTVRCRRRRTVARQRHRLHLVVVLEARHGVRHQRHRIAVGLRHVVGLDRQHTPRNGERAVLAFNQVVLKTRPLHVGHGNFIAPLTIGGRRRCAHALQHHRLHLVVVLEARHGVCRQRHRIAIGLHHVVGLDRQRAPLDGELTRFEIDDVVLQPRTLRVRCRDFIAIRLVRRRLRRARTRQRHGIDGRAMEQFATGDKEFVSHEVQHLAVWLPHVPRRNLKGTPVDRERSAITVDPVVFKARAPYVAHRNRILRVRCLRHGAIARERNGRHRVAVQQTDHLVLLQRLLIAIRLRVVLGLDRQGGRIDRQRARHVRHAAVGGQIKAANVRQDDTVRADDGGGIGRLRRLAQRIREGDVDARRRQRLARPLDGKNELEVGTGYLRTIDLVRADGRDAQHRQFADGRHAVGGVVRLVVVARGRRDRRAIRVGTLLGKHAADPQHGVAAGRKAVADRPDEGVRSVDLAPAGRIDRAGVARFDGDRGRIDADRQTVRHLDPVGGRGPDVRNGVRERRPPRTGQMRRPFDCHLQIGAGRDAPLAQEDGGVDRVVVAVADDDLELVNLVRVKPLGHRHRPYDCAVELHRQQNVGCREGQLALIVGDDVGDEVLRIRVLVDRRDLHVPAIRQLGDVPRHGRANVDDISLGVVGRRI